MPLCTAWGYDTLRILARIIRESAGGRESIRTELYELRGYAGASGEISVSAEGSSRVSVSLSRFLNGRLKLVEK